MGSDPLTGVLIPREDRGTWGAGHVMREVETGVMRPPSSPGGTSLLLGQHLPIDAFPQASQPPFLQGQGVGVSEAVRATWQVPVSGRREQSCWRMGRLVWRTPSKSRWHL